MLFCHWYTGDTPPLVGVLAVNVNDVPAQMLTVVGVIVRDGTIDGFTVIVIMLLVAVVGETQVEDDVITTLTWFVLASVVVVKVALLLPTAVAFMYHWYEGVAPPFTGVAVKVTDVPAQILLSASLETILTPAVPPTVNVALPLLPTTPVEVGFVEVTATLYPENEARGEGNVKTLVSDVIAPSPELGGLGIENVPPSSCQLPLLLKRCAW